MPFRHAHYVVIALVALTVLAFWPGYFSILGTAPWGFHFHGITATLWMLMLAFQSWSIHARRNALHRSTGIASLMLFPVYFAGMVAVVLSMALGTANGDPFYQIYGARLGTMDITSVFLIGYLYYHALADRRSVQLHARYMLATPLPLLMPIVGRVISHLTPGLIIHGPQEFGHFAWSVRIASVIAIGIAAWLYSTAPRHGRPFLVSGVAMAAQALLFDTVGFMGWWQRLFASLATLPLVAMLIAAGLIGAALSWFGWIAAARPVRRAAAA